MLVGSSSPVLNALFILFQFAFPFYYLTLEALVVALVLIRALSM